MLLTLASRLVQFVLMFISVKVMTTVLPPAEYGKVALITAITAFFAFFLINPVGTFINRQLNTWHSAQVLRAAFCRYASYLLLVSAFALLLIAAADHLEIYALGQTLQLSVLVALTLLFATANQTLIPSLNILGQTRPFAWLTIATAVATLLAAWALTNFLGADAYLWLGGVVLGQTICAAAAWLVFARSKTLGWRTLEQTKPSTIFNTKQVLSFCGPVALSAGFVWLHMHGYRLVLGEYVSLVELGLFAAGYTLAIQIMAAVELILNTWFQPGFYRACDSNKAEERSAAWSTYATSIWFPSALAAAALFSGAPLFVQYMLGDSYQSTAQYVQFGALVEFCRILGGVTGLYFHQQKQTTGLVLPTAVGAVLAIGLIVYWVPLHGLSFALPALCAGGVLSFLLMYGRVLPVHRPTAKAVGMLVLVCTLAALVCVFLQAVHTQFPSAWALAWLVLWSAVGFVYLIKRFR
ncbi:MAG TPA: oligosaccharide flippase family protein [Limnobacter sp.]|nr:oligosaccharide flippase family protein [Limnobacter sp.]